MFSGKTYMYILDYADNVELKHHMKPVSNVMYVWGGRGVCAVRQAVMGVNGAFVDV